MILKDRLEKVIAPWSLLTHPFYQAWEMGTLPTPALKQYAEEYGAFITTLPTGWKTLDDHETEHEEMEHVELWEAFAKTVATKITKAELSETKELVRTAKKLFSKKSTALGALYAFEVQQPKTASSKLAGLKKFYKAVNETAYPYFEIHSHNEHESEKLLRIMSNLTEAEQEEALKACETMCKALWNGLSGIYKNSSVL